MMDIDYFTSVSMTPMKAMKHGQQSLQSMARVLAKRIRVTDFLAQFGRRRIFWCCYFRPSLPPPAGRCHYQPMGFIPG
jgi:hypothetical protein